MKQKDAETEADLGKYVMSMLCEVETGLRAYTMK
jgi:hypothetical protein